MYSCKVSLETLSVCALLSVHPMPAVIPWTESRHIAVLNCTAGVECQVTKMGNEQYGEAGRLLR